MKIFKITLWLIVFGLLISCGSNNDSDEECVSSETVFVTAVDSPSSGNVNETIQVETQFSVINGCGQFGRFIETVNGNSRNIEVEARYEGCICTQDIPTRTVIYEFTATTTGDYELNFKSSETDFISVNITIN